MGKRISELALNTDPNASATVPVEYNNANYKVPLSCLPGMVPTGGSQGQVLSKTSLNNYETEWIDLPDAEVSGYTGYVYDAFGIRIFSATTGLTKSVVVNVPEPPSGGGTTTLGGESVTFGGEEVTFGGE